MHAAELVAVGFAVACLCAPAGISGAFILLPIQVSLLGVPTSAATASNLLYNVVSTPGGIARYRREGRLDRDLARVVIYGSLPGVIVGSLLRVSLFQSPAAFKTFVGAVLVALAAKLLLDVWAGWHHRKPIRAGSRSAVLAVSAAVGVVGGIYGIGGGSILAPYLVAMAGLSTYRVAGAALLATLVTSAAGMLTLIALGSGPDWTVGLLLGAGGLLGSYVGAALQRRIVESSLKLLIAALAGALGIAYLVEGLRR
jgi:uncharacterized membrane protein YfcA